MLEAEEGWPDGGGIVAACRYRAAVSAVVYDIDVQCSKATPGQEKLVKVVDSSKL